MRVLITGANGMLAKAVKERFSEHELFLTDVEQLDITNENMVMEKVKEISPNYIINCAAYTAVDKAEEKEVYDIVEKVNAYGPKNLAVAAEEVGATFVHVSTDYVFDGDLNVECTYKENDKTAPVTVYGITKLKGEEFIKENCEKYYILRTAWLYGDGNNFVRTMLKLGKEREEITVVEDQHGSPTYAVDLADIIFQIIEKKIPYGIYHTTNQGYTTWYDFTKVIFELANITCKVIPVTSEQFVRPAKRPFNSQLSMEKIIDEGVIIPEYKDALKRYLEDEKEI